MKRGDIVRITDSDGGFYDVGDTGKLLQPDEDEPECWLVDFNGRSNLEVTGNGKWCVHEDDMALAFDEDPEEVMA